jgi:Protein of unknown function (DUF3303)
VKSITSQVSGAAFFGGYKAIDGALPDGVGCISSHVSADLGRCFPWLEAHDVTALRRGVAEWAARAQFEIVPVLAGSDTAAALASAPGIPGANPASARAAAQSSGAPRRRPSASHP